MLKSVVRRGVSTLAFLLIAAPLAAQTPDAPKNVLSLNPFGIVFTVINAEFERAVSPNVSVGVSTTWWDFDEDIGDEADLSEEFTYTSADAKLRYYPGNVLRGFSVGVLGGLTKVNADGFDCSGTTCVEDNSTETAPSAGITLDYSWRLGAREKFYIGLGVGAKRIFIDDNDDDDFTVAYPFGRFNIGWAF